MRTHWQLKSTENRADYKWKIFGVILFVSFLLAVPAEALRLKTNWAERVDLSEKVLRGQVVRVNSYWNFDKNLIYTDVVVLIDEYLKGDGPKEITITLPGGTVGDESQSVSDVPQFDVGDYGVILLEWSGQVTGGPDGVYLLEKPAAEDELLSWIRSYISGQTNVSFEELSNETPAQPMQQETSYATITGITPSAVSAGTGNVITITGSGFGDSCCTPFWPMILFRYVGSSWMGRSSDIVSWSDTEIQSKVWTAIVNSYPYSPGSWDDTVIFVNSSGQKESSYPLTITFGYGFAKWPTPPVSYYVNEAGGPSGTDAAIQAAANTWSGGGANFSFNYAGTTQNGFANDGLNVISFGDLGSSSIIGQSRIYYSAGMMTQADIQFNTRFNWSTDTPTPGDKMDLQTVALHELGHWLWLLDLYGAYDTAKAMYGYGSYGQMKRTLTSGDQQGIQWIYPSPLTVQFSAASSSGSEATTPASITVTLSAASGQTVTVNYATADGTATAGNDYTSTSGTLTFNPGVTSQTINVPIINDTAVEGDEWFTVTLSSPVNAILGATTTHTYTINNDDNAGTIQFSSGTYSVNENGGSILITVTRTGGSSGAVGVSYATSNGSATAGSDYTSASGTLSWANGDASNKTFSVPITNDTLDESNETFTVTLSSPTGGAALGSPSSSTVTITDDDVPYLITLQSPSNGAIFHACSLISKHQPAFTWTTAETFTSCTILLSTSGGALINKATIRAPANTWTPSSSVWKKIMTASNQNGEIYWKVVGTRPNRTTYESEAWGFSIGSPQPVTINSPPGGPLPGATPPTFDFATSCNLKFKLEISSLDNFSDSKKIKSFNYTTRDPNVDQRLVKTLSSFQWSSVKKMVGTGTGYFRIKAWDGINRESVSATRSFTVQQ